MVLDDFQATLGLLTLLANIIRIQATATTISIVNYQGVDNGNGRIIQLQEAL